MKLLLSLPFFCLLSSLAGLVPARAQQSPLDLFTFRNQTIPGNLRSPMNTGLMIRPGDYVYVEVHGIVKVGDYLGEANGVCLIDPPALSIPGLYSKYAGVDLGAVVVGVGSQTIACGRMFRQASHPIYYEVADKSRMVTDHRLTTVVSYVPGAYLLATSGGTLTIDINDDKVDDNTGTYQVEVIVMRQTAHMQRNLFNKCPNREPDEDAACGKRDGWEQEPIRSMYYHGFNNAYRGSGQFAGCQCVYDRGTLLDGGKHIGSFDIGFWIGKSNDTDPAARHRHLILDMLPHDLYESNFGTNAYIGQKTYECR